MVKVCTKLFDKVLHAVHVALAWLVLAATVCAYQKEQQDLLVVGGPNKDVFTEVLQALEVTVACSRPSVYTAHTSFKHAIDVTYKRLKCLSEHLCACVSCWIS